MPKIGKSSFTQRLNMKTKLNDAASLLYRCPKLGLTIIEAVANAFDAGADRIDINISGTSVTENKNCYISDLKVIISDNGKGFDEEDIERFSSLFNKADDLHRGMGRLSYVSMFKNIHIKSITKEGLQTDFLFNDDMGIEPKQASSPDGNSGTVLELSKLKWNRLKTKEIEPSNIKELLYKEFFITLFLLKQEEKLKHIKIVTEIKSSSDSDVFSKPEQKTEQITSRDIVDLKPYELSVEATPYKCFYNFVESGGMFKNNFIAFNIDNRTKEICKDYSDSFHNKSAVFIITSICGAEYAETDNCRLEVIYKEKSSQSVLQQAVKEALSKLAREQVVDFAKFAKHRISEITKSKPFLSKFIDEEQFGLVNEDKIIENAYAAQLKERKKFFQNNGYVKTRQEFNQRFQFASVILAEYVIGRACALEQMKAISENDKESVVHNFLCPMKTSLQEGQDEATNLWILDERFMNFTYVCSDKNIKELISYIESKAQEEISFPKDNIRPDLALVFSANPYDKNIDYVDAVLIELKRRGKGKFYLSSIEDELMERANTLQDQCSKLRRAWYYGIMDFMECGLEERDLRSRGFIPLFSSGHCYYKSIQLFGKDNQSKQVGILDFYLMDYTAVITDAESRLSTFRNVLQKAFSK